MAGVRWCRAVGLAGIFIDSQYIRFSVNFSCTEVYEVRSNRDVPDRARVRVDLTDRTAGFVDGREAGVRRNRRLLFMAGYVLGVVLVALVIAGLVALIFRG